MSATPVQRVAFGSCQERRVFPLHYAPDRLGNQMARPEASHVGPGCYDNHEFGTLLYDLQRTPGSKKGYSLSARTAARFPPCSKGATGEGKELQVAPEPQQKATPSPQQYQHDQSQSRVPPPGKTPFDSTTQRFKSVSCTTQDSPGPGTYDHNEVTNRKVNWPKCFGSPDWSRMPQIEKKSLRVKMSSEKEFLKHRSRVAYLSLYY